MNSGYISANFVKFNELSPNLTYLAIFPPNFVRVVGTATENRRIPRPSFFDGAPQQAQKNAGNSAGGPTVGVALNG